MRTPTLPSRARSAPSRPLADRPALRPDLDELGAGSRRVDDQRASDLVVHVRQDLPRPLVSVAGELDVATVGLLTATLDHVRHNLQRRRGVGRALDLGVDVDLTAVTFADGHGLAPVLDDRTRIIAASRAVRRVLLVLCGQPLAGPPPPGGRPPAAQGMA